MLTILHIGETTNKTMFPSFFSLFENIIIQANTLLNLPL